MSPGEFVPLALYLVQQLGIMLGVGAATVLLVSYLVSMRDGVVAVKEAHFARVVQHVLEIGLVCIVISGAIITSIHAMSGQYEVIASPAYFFKWILVALVSVALVMRRSKPFLTSMWEGFVGATWYALFILHMMAPITAWTDLLFMYGAWIAGFMLLWISFTKLITARNPVTATPVPVAAKAAVPAPIVKAVPSPAPKPVPPPVPKVQQPVPPPSPAMPKPVPPPPVPPVAIKPVLPVVAHAELEAPHKPAEPAPIKASVPVKPPAPHAAEAPQKPKELIVAENIPMPTAPKDTLVKNIDDSDQIPHIYVMPRSPEDAEKHLRSAVLTGFA